MVSTDSETTLHVAYARAAPPQITVALRLASASGATSAEKQLVSETGSCAELAATTAFTAAILLDPRLMFPRPKDRTTPGQSLDSNAPSTWPWYESREDVPPVPAAPSAPWRWRGGATAGACLGCGPSPSTGAGLFLGVSKGRLGLDVGGRADMPATTTTTPSGRSIRSSLAAFEAFPHARFAGLRVGLLGSAGALSSDSSENGRTSFWAAAGGAALRFAPPSPR